ncbi:MAG: NAD(P)H-dependent flavin oxidoreductase [Bryobacteraceae bacterium]
MLRTRLSAEYGLKTPFVSAGMGFIAMPPLVAAVSNAGGLGILGPGAAPPTALRHLVRATRELTSRPFGVDFIIENTAFGPNTVEGHIDVCIEEKVPVVVFFWNMPPANWIERLRSAGTRVWLQTGSPEGAREGVEAGMDVIVAQGAEAGGHNKSTVALFTLLPVIVDAVAPVPVVAAGGIADGRGVAGALALGAEGVWVGTCLLASQEANAHPEYKRRVLSAGASDIARTSIFGPEWPDAPMRVIRNRVVREWEGRDSRTPPQPDPPQFIGTTQLGGEEYRLPKFSVLLATPETEGDFEEMCLAAGESAGLVHQIKPAGQIVRDMMREAELIIRGRMAALTTAAGGAPATS